ncbi:hypothetical protein ACFSB1_07145 [Halopseudomonas phragmitis]|uniref:Uncharacterized protein n=1 Tax=Halopseudomonas phragmitis TaxID=1931241 RepID=A0A1V0B765_9GAMM|nr:hypothetical protein [Halopseudomonas phragmitis]AQZ95757.1 hypothetical protein BVH74_13805 [Halopseudomonas phragmitis]
MIRIADVTITRFADLNEVSTADLLAYYNSVTGKNTKQFLKRAKGMQQVWALIAPQLAQVEGAAQEEPAEVTPEQAESVQEPATLATVEAAPATAPSTAEEPAEGAATAEAKAKPAGLKARVEDLLAALASGPRTVAELAGALGMEQKKVRSTIDTARRVGHTIACVGRGTFALPEAAQ